MRVENNDLNNINSWQQSLYSGDKGIQNKGRLVAIPAVAADVALEALRPLAGIVLNSGHSVINLVGSPLNDEEKYTIIDASYTAGQALKDAFQLPVDLVSTVVKGILQVVSSLWKPQEALPISSFYHKLHPPVGGFEEGKEPLLAPSLDKLREWQKKCYLVTPPRPQPVEGEEVDDAPVQPVAATTRSHLTVALVADAVTTAALPIIDFIRHAGFAVANLAGAPFSARCSLVGTLHETELAARNLFNFIPEVAATVFRSLMQLGIIWKDPTDVRASRPLNDFYTAV